MTRGVRVGQPRRPSRGAPSIRPRVTQTRDTLIPPPVLAPHRTQEDPPQVIWQLRVLALRRRPRSGEQLPDHHAECIHIGALICVLEVAILLGRGEVGGTWSLLRSGRERAGPVWSYKL